MSLTTPSGIKVTLTSPKTTPLGQGPSEANDVRVAVITSPAKNVENATLPLSPLQKRVGKNHPLRISWNVRFEGDQLTSMTSNSEDGTATLSYRKRLARPVLPELTVYVTQEAKLQEVPVTFTVPIREGKPKVDWQSNRSTRTI